MLFEGGAATVAGTATALPDAIASPATALGRIAWDAYLEGGVKALAALSVTVPAAREVVLSGRVARVPGVRDEFARRVRRLNGGATVHLLSGFAPLAKQAAQGAALIADGLAGGQHAALVTTLGIRDAAGTALDHLYVISPAAARARLGLP
jgi:predicted butyrate kinase (DUF1464 family)